MGCASMLLLASILCMFFFQLISSLLRAGGA
jgi:hypothetical protein